MRLVSTALAAALLAGAPALALAQGNQTGNQAGNQAGNGAASAPSWVPAQSHATQSPFVNPSAAGTQQGPRAHLFPPAASQRGEGTSLDRAAKSPFSMKQAERIIARHGFREVTGLYRNATGGWEAMAVKHGRQVRIALGPNGRVSEER